MEKVEEKLWSCNEPNSFANLTIKNRLPEMVQVIVVSNQDRYPEKTLALLEALAYGMKKNKPIPPNRSKSDKYYNYWNNVYNNCFKGKNWQEVPFYYIEAYLFRLILEIVEYFEPESKFYKMDPFQRTKIKEITAINIWTVLSSSIQFAFDEKISLEKKINFILSINLWANKIDSNFKPGSTDEVEAGNDKSLIVDSRKEIIEFLMNGKAEEKEKSFSIILDNAGAECLNDLLLSVFLLHYNFTNKITLHAKLYPTYVSDVILEDIDFHIGFIYTQSLNKSLNETARKTLKFLYNKLSRLIQNKRLCRQESHFWNSAELFSDINNHKKLNSMLSNDRLVIIKGDANYRRLVLCKKWKPTVPFECVVNYFPTNLIALRTMKSDCIVGMKNETVLKLDQEDEHWRHNGKRGIIQCCLTSERPHNILLLFDIDGTLSKSRLQMEQPMYKTLCDAKKKVYIGTVGGSDFAKAQEQLGGKKYGDITKFFDYVFAENGLVAYHNGVKLNDYGIRQELSNKEIKDFVNFVLNYVAELDIPIKRGTFVEFRTGMINVSPIGRNCSQQERIEFFEFDKKHKIREKMIEAIKTNLPQLAKKITMSIGGQISFDVFPNGWDKRYCLQFLEDKKTKKMSFDKVYFFGDKTYLGGNDYEIFTDERTIGTTVKSPDDTQNHIYDLLSKLD